MEILSILSVMEVCLDVRDIPGINQMKRTATAANPYWEQKTARYAHLFVTAPVLLTMSATVNGPTVKARAIKHYN